MNSDARRREERETDRPPVTNPIPQERRMTPPDKPTAPGLNDQEKQNLALWNSWRSPPQAALKTIKGGRLKGMTDIDPMWRYGSLTRAFGPIGIGWYFEVLRTWTEAAGTEVLAFAEVALYLRTKEPEPGNLWSQAIIGHGGNKLISQENSGLHNNDDAFKMAVTDALGTACKMLGIAADVYAGRLDDSKYSSAPPAGGSAPSGKLTETKLCPKCGGPMWDNRSDSKFPNSPDFKCKDKSCGTVIRLEKPADPAAAAAIDPPTPAR